MDLSDVTPEALSGILSSLTEEDTENRKKLLYYQTKEK